LCVVGPADGVGVVAGHGLEVAPVEGLVAGPVGLDVRRWHGSSSTAVAVDDEEILAATACANPSLAFPQPFRILASTDETTPTSTEVA
jgi:hypothetical protein